MKQMLQHRCTCNSESVICYWESICSCSSALDHCPIQPGCNSECQGGGHISQSSTHHNSGVGGICEGGHKLKVFTLYRCNIIAVQTAVSGCSTRELDTSSSWKEWFNNPVQKSSLCHSAGVSHHLSRTDLSHTNTGVQDNSSCIQGNFAEGKTLPPKLTR